MKAEQIRTVLAEVLQRVLQEMLQRRGSVYASRIIVPVDLQPLVRRREITRSLRTGSRQEAARLLSLWETHIGCYLSTIRAQRRRMTREDLDEITQRYLRVTFDEIEARLALEDWTPAGREAHVWDLGDEGHRLAGALAHGDYSAAMDAAKALAPQANPETLRKLARRFLEVKHEAIAAEIAAFNGESLALPRLVSIPAVSVAKPREESPRLSEVINEYSAQRVTEGNWTPKTELQNRTIFALLVELMGDPRIGEVSKDAIRTVGNDVVSLPSNMTKRFPGLTPREVLQRLEGNTTTPRLEPRSVNKYRQLLRSLFKWATENDYITSNPAAVLRDVKEGKAREDRKPLTDDDLRAYFRELPQSPHPRPFLYWIPRILAYTGMRLGECSQLRKEDFREAQGLPVFDINDEDGKTLKNEASRRQVPIHPRLIELGLLEFVDKMPAGFLWPANMRATDNPQRGDVDRLSKLLARLLRSAGIVDPKKTGAHSFRHTVTTRLKSESVPEYQIADLIGHDDDSMTTGRYGKNTNMARLVEVLKLLQLPV